MKIGILTFWWSADNYGQLLQAYALQSYLRAQGHDAYLIRYKWEKDFTPSPLALRLLKACNPVLLFRFFSTRRRIRAAKQEQAAFDRGFDAFRDRYIAQSPRVYNSLAELREDPPEADCYIVGSDQVWNFGAIPLARCRSAVHAYFLDFGKPETARLSYAASWGRVTLPDEYAREIAPLLSRFRYVSVREESGVSLCVQCGFPGARWVRDPTLLLDAEAWRALYKENELREPTGRYLFLYMLGNECEFDIETVYRFARERNLQVVYVTGNSVADRREKWFATIPEWLFLVDHAEYVVTNSFHCCVFSILFGKRFGAVPLTGNAAGMNARMDSLFELFRMKPRWLRGDFSVLESEADARPPDAFRFNLQEALGETSEGTRESR